jgi:hypothetical protein
MLNKIKKMLEQVKFNSLQKHAIKCTKKQLAKRNSVIVGYPFLVFLELELPKIFEEHGYDVAEKALFDKLDDMSKNLDKEV